MIPGRRVAPPGGDAASVSRCEVRTPAAFVSRVRREVESFGSERARREAAARGRGFTGNLTLGVNAVDSR